jgi:hypothetical protein
MSLLDDLAQDQYVIRDLCKLRVKLATVRHDSLFLKNINPAHCDDEAGSEVDGLFPPRRSWMRPRQEYRSGRSAPEINLNALYCTVMREWRRADSPEWMGRLKATVATVQAKLLSQDGGALSVPRIVPVHKRGKEYRPIAVHSIADRIVGGICARYLRSLFDADFLSCSYAFRTGTSERKAPQHHDAVAAITAFRRKHDQRSLWVAEADLSAFFDSVSHLVARSALNDAVSRANRRGVITDNRAISIFESYLRSYSFDGVAEPLARKAFARRRLTGSLKRPSVLPKEWNPLAPISDVGIPQGGALSCVIANLVLHSADVAVMSKSDDLEMIYARYCDDMILIHCDREKCQEAFLRYRTAVEGMRLTVHAPVDPVDYKVQSERRRWWSDSTKSRGTYEWSSPGIPWLGFVGYQIRYDGLLRIRPSSIDKECKKQVRQCDEVLRAVVPNRLGRGVHPAVRRSWKQILYRLECRLISMSVGRVGISGVLGKGPDARGFCWASGFKFLRGQAFVAQQLFRLDANRCRQLRRVKVALLGVAAEGQVDARRKRVPRFRGYPFSYFASIVGGCEYSGNAIASKRTVLAEDFGARVATAVISFLRCLLTWPWKLFRICRQALRERQSSRGSPR